MERDREIDEDYEGLVSLVCSGGCAVSTPASATSPSGNVPEVDIEMDYENEGSYSEGTSDSSEDFESDGPVDEMREYEFKVDIDGGVRQVNAAGAVDGMELEFTLPDYSATSPSDATSPTPSPTPSPTASSFNPCDTSSTSLGNHLQLDTSSDSLLDFSPTLYAIDSFRRPFSPFVLSRFPAHCLRDSMQPVLGLGTPDNGVGRMAWKNALSSSSSMQTPPPTPNFESMETQDPSLGLSTLFGYGVDISANLGYSSLSTPSAFESSMAVSAEGVIGGI